MTSQLLALPRSLTLPLSLTIALLAGGGALCPGADSVSDSKEVGTPAISIPDKEVATPTISLEDAEFVRQGLIQGMSQTKTTELALKRTLTTGEREFAQKIHDAQGTATEELTALARSKGVGIPLMLDADSQKTLDELGKENDQDFPEAFLDGQVEAHEEMIDRYKDVGSDAKDVDLKAYASTRLMAVQADSDQAIELAKRR